jgi:hypothetical protein
VQLVEMEEDKTEYLKESWIVDYNNLNIQKKVLELSEGLDRVGRVKNIYEFVRDEVSHSLDIKGQTVTFRASEVLKTGQGLCFAKSNLLAAMLRFIGVPTGFCYQRLTHEGGYVLHGLNAVFLEGKWHRLDARGNRSDVNAQFSMGEEKLAFPVSHEGEVDYPGIYSKPVESVVNSFKGAENVDEVMKKLLKARI